MEFYTLIQQHNQKLRAEKAKLEKALEPLANVQAELEFIQSIEVKQAEQKVDNTKHLAALEELIK